MEDKSELDQSATLQQCVRVRVCVWRHSRFKKYVSWSNGYDINEIVQKPVGNHKCLCCNYVAQGRRK